MARRVFFSFHYERDIWRASQVRNSWVTKPDREDAGFWDAASWEEVKKKGDEAIKRWIDKNLEGTSVTVVLIGRETAERPYVLYEIEQSYKTSKGLLGIYIHNMRDKTGQSDLAGSNPFDKVKTVSSLGVQQSLATVVKVRDWVLDNGYDNLGDWIEAAAKTVGR
jgi:hypothetical protein